MSENQNPCRAISLVEMQRSLPSPWDEDLTDRLQAYRNRLGAKVVVLDDDPTGTQTVHGVSIFGQWSLEELTEELHSDRGVFFLLTNSRSLCRDEACALNDRIGRELRNAAARATGSILVVSRSDSTLRGHFPHEVDSLVRGLGQEPDGILILPFFEEGGRFTIGDIHYVLEDDKLLPVGETEYARDASFGYRNSNLRSWVEEKSAGRWHADQVQSISLEDIREGGPDAVKEKLIQLSGYCPCIVNLAGNADLRPFVAGLLSAIVSGKRFIYRTAASFIPVLAGISSKSLLTKADLEPFNDAGALFIVGSHVPKTNDQLRLLLQEPDLRGFEIDAAGLLSAENPMDMISNLAGDVDNCLAQGMDAVIYTSREVVRASDAESNLSIGARISDALVQFVQALRVRPRYVLAKGGITASDIATKGFAVRKAEVLGQISLGVPVWKFGPESLASALVYIVFPGNVGGYDALVDIRRTLAE